MGFLIDSLWVSFGFPQDSFLASVGPFGIPLGFSRDSGVVTHGRPARNLLNVLQDDGLELAENHGTTHGELILVDVRTSGTP